MAVLCSSDSNSEDYIVELVGDLDESAEFPSARPRLVQRVIFECQNAKRVNSYAIQQWIVWMRALDPRQQYVFRDVPPPIVNTFNIVQGFLPQECTIESFYFPFECEKCESEESLLLRRGREFIEAQNGEKAKLLLPTEINCMNCKGGMKPAMAESRYTRFLNRRES